MFASIQNGAVMGCKGRGGRGEGGGKDERGGGEQVFVQLQVKSQFILIFHKNFLNEYDLWIKKLCSRGS